MEEHMTAAMLAITVILHTNMGAITLLLDKEHAPATTENFITYVNAGFYNNTIFHRVIDGFMIQGGGMTADMSSKKTHPTIENEADNGLTNKTGTIAMARTSDPHSASSQFFINLADNDFLNFKAKNDQGWGYCVFGKVIDGMDVVKKIGHVKTTSKAGHQDVPVEPVILEHVEIVPTKSESTAETNKENTAAT